MQRGQVVAVRVLEHDRSSYGHGAQRYWLALLTSVPFELPENMVNAGSELEAGWWVVRARWFNLVQLSHRAFVLLKDPTLISCSSMIRLTGIDWEKLQNGKKHGPKTMHFLSETQHNRLDAAVGK